MVTVHSNLNFSRFQVLLTRCKSSLTVWREATIIGLSSESEESCYVDKKTSETSGKKITKEQLSENGICLFSDRIFNDLICIFHFYFPAVSPGTANNFCSDTSNFPDASNSSIATDTLQHVFQISFSGAPLATLFEHILNIYTSGRSFIFATLKTVNEAFLDPFSTSFFLLLLGVLLSFLYTVFSNVLLVGEARFFLEARTYQQTTIQ